MSIVQRDDGRLAPGSCGESKCVAHDWHYDYDHVVVPNPERDARALLARHFRVLASAVNVTDWPAYIRSCADAHDAGTAWLDHDMVHGGSA